MRKLAAAVCLILMFSWAPLGGELVWESTLMKSRAGPEDKKLVYLFPFANEGRKPVTILSVVPARGCAVDKLAKKTYRPGESGVIRAVLALDRKKGRQSKTIAVRTDAPGEESGVLLTAEAVLPDLMTIRPRLVYWRTGGESASKSCFIRTNPDYPVGITKVKCSNEQFDLNLKPLKTGSGYELEVTPKTTGKKTRATIFMETEAGETLRVYAGVIPD